MKDLKQIVAENIIDIRKKNNLTQLELAEKLNYTDKAVSKWERGESLPYISVLMEIAKMFGVTVDYLLSEHDTETSVNEIEEGQNEKKKRNSSEAATFLICMCIIGTWIIGFALFVCFRFVFSMDTYIHYVPLIITLPVSVVVWLIMNSIFRFGRQNFIIISVLMWMIIIAVQLCLLMFGVQSTNYFYVYLAGVPGQAFIVLWKLLKKHRKPYLNS